ncbi:MAG TPA: DUF2252 domain-containing protein [bacterium]|nr:DUF2252 domain-containing protein [bacterium]
MAIFERRKAVADSFQAGQALRNRLPRGSHAAWKPPKGRIDPVKVLIETSKGRIPSLLPIRYGRMAQSPFGFFRGAAAVMAADLAKTPVSGIQTQLCGDCHLLNFGVFGTPERHLLFDINDFDETLPGPWEWDLKRLTTSFIVAGRNSRFKAAESRAAARACARSYRKHIAEFSKMRVLDLWYARLDLELDLLAKVENRATFGRIKKRIAKVRAHTVVEDDFPELTESKGGQPRIRDNPPLIYHPPEAQEADFQENLEETLARYRDSLAEDRQALLDRYRRVDVAMKVVGVGSVGTWCGIALHMAGPEDPLFLQAKEARPSVLEPHLGKSRHPNHGQRVVAGQRLMQSASDIFLGWTQGKKGRHFYIRQLRDMKIKPRVEIYTSVEMETYARFCGWALARAHAKSGNAAAISGYLGKSGKMDESLAAFGEDYADQNERDHRALTEAIRQGRIEAYFE